MPKKLTLAVYLQKRGAVKALTRIEAEAFGVPYPLQKGWAVRLGDAEITAAMLEHLKERIGRAKLSTAEKAQRGLDGAVAPVPTTMLEQKKTPSRAGTVPALRQSPIAGFVLRQAGRYRTRKPTPRT